MDYIANNNGETNLCVLSALIQGEGQYLMKEIDHAV